MAETQVPGFTPEQVWTLQQIVETAVRNANEHDARVAKLEETVFGNGKEGLGTCVTKITKDMSSLVWWYRALVAAVLGSWLTLLATFVT